MDRSCPVCDRVISPDAPVSLLHGEVLHKECFDATMGAQKARRRPRERGDGRSGGGQQ
jgi:hypothetical protein